MGENIVRENSYPNTFVCTFCREEFPSLGLIFSHMNEAHEKKTVAED